MNPKSITWILLFLVGFTACNVLPFAKYRLTKKEGKFPSFSDKPINRSDYEFRENYDVTYYDLDLEVQPEVAHIIGSTNIGFVPKPGTKTILLDLHRRLKLINITSENGTKLSWKRKKDFLLVTFNVPLEAELTTIKIDYKGKPPRLLDEGPVFWQKDEKGKHWISSVTQGIGTHWIMPCKYLLSDKSDSLRMKLTVPEDLMAIGNGKLIGIQKNAGKATYEWQLNNPINIYNISFNIGDFRQINVPYQNELGSQQLQFFVLPEHEEEAKEFMQQCVEILQYYESTYGLFPWWQDGFKIIESAFPAGMGMEHQSAISIGLKYKNDYIGYSSVIVHEIAHEWWGNSVSARDYGDLWLHEGFATYHELLFVEEKYGPSRYVQLIDRLKRRTQNQRPLQKPLNVRYNSFVSSKDLDIYPKGALLLHTLRVTINDDEVFMRLLKSFYEKYKGTLISSDDFIQHVNLITEDDYTWLFNCYLNDHRVPALQYSIEESVDEQTKLFYKWKSDPGVGFKLPVSLINGTDTLKFLPTTAVQSLEFAKADTVYLDQYGGYILYEENGDLLKP